MGVYDDAMPDAVPPPPLHLDVRDFLATGSLGSVRLGDTTAALRDRLPPAVDDGVDLPPGSAIWAYGALELHFVDFRLALIWCDNLPALADGSPTDGLTVDPWIVCAPRRRTLEELLGEFARHGWRLQLSQPGHRYSMTVRILDSNVELHFEENPHADISVPPSWPGFELIAFGLR